MKKFLVILPLFLLLVGCRLPGAETPDGTVKEGTLEYLGVSFAPEQNLAAVTKTFDTDKTTIIVWRVNLRNNDPYSRHTMTAEWRSPDGKVLWREERSFSTGGEPTIIITGGKGYTAVGGWAPGVHTIQFYIDGKPIAEEIFHVTGRAPDREEPLTLTGITFFNPDDITRPVRVFDKDKVTEVLWFASFAVTDEAVGRHQVIATWLDPEGKPLWREERTMSVAAGQKSISIGGGQGYASPADWSPGDYTLLLTVEGEAVGDGSFKVGTVTDPVDDPKPTEGLDLIGLAFVDRDDYDKIQSTFENHNTEMIVWVVTLLRQPDGPTGIHTVTAEWYDPEETLRWTQNSEFELSRGDETRQVINGRGYTEPGWWDLGKWTVLFYLNDAFIGMESFTVR